MIHIACCFDKNYQQHFGASLTSLLLNFGDDGTDLTIHVVTDEVDTAFGQKLNWFKRRFRAHVEVRLLKSEDLRELVGLRTQTAMVSHTTPATWFRLLLPNILPADIERLIYLDPDTIVLSDISELFHTDMQSAPLAAVVDYNNTRMSAMYELKNYVNSGVLLMDLQEWRDKDYVALCLEHARRTRDEHLFTDQCAINTFFAERILLTGEEVESIRRPQ